MSKLPIPALELLASSEFMLDTGSVGRPETIRVAIGEFGRYIVGPGKGGCLRWSWVRDDGKGETKRIPVVRLSRDDREWSSSILVELKSNEHPERYLVYGKAKDMPKYLVYATIQIEDYNTRVNFFARLFEASKEERCLLPQEL